MFGRMSKLFRRPHNLYCVGVDVKPSIYVKNFRGHVT